MAELCLGTVQLGMKYGINNQIGRQPTREEAFDMLDYAIGQGIDTFDTACAYGEAEEILGSYFRSSGRGKNIKVISKLRPNILESGEPAERVIIRECKSSLSRLSIEQLDGYLLHTPEYIYRDEVVKTLVKLKQQGYARNIGVSIYDLKEGYAALETGVIDYIQLPYSILDQRGIKEGFIKAAKSEGVKIFTRSAFLQGLFMMDNQKIPMHLKSAVPYLNIVNHITKQYDVDIVSVILQFVVNEDAIDYLVFGVETKRQLQEDMGKARQNSVPGECIQQIKEKINGVSESVIFPSLWGRGRS